jgi:arylformamidase
MNYIWLSHPFEKTVPTYGGSFQPIQVKSIKDLTCGDSCNTFQFQLENHWGTHIDAPAHFFNEGKKITDYAPQDLVFNKVQLIEINIQPTQLIASQDLNLLKSDTELLLIKTNFEQFRTTETYGKMGPGMSSEAGFYLRKNFPNLKVIGFDFISLSSFQHREEGRLAHRAFLDPNAEGHPILILEDLTLKDLNHHPKQVIVSPLRIESIDSAPCTVVAQI